MSPTSIYSRSFDLRLAVERCWFLEIPYVKAALLRRVCDYMDVFACGCWLQHM